MTKTYRHYGWHLSFFSGKTRSYLLYKGVPFEDVKINLKTMMTVIPEKTGARVMPVVETPSGEWLQDTTVIIDHFEKRFPEKPVVPADPVLRFASKLFEAWIGEWWTPIAMHTRWTYPENHAAFAREAGDNLLPYFPRFIKNKAVQKIAERLQGYLPMIGVIPEQHQMMNDWTLNVLDLFEAHFAQHPYLLGGKPTLADFSLMGPLYGHLGHDPWPAREMIAPRPHVRHWVDDMAAPKRQATDAALDENIPETLNPVFHIIFNEFIPMIQQIADQVSEKSKTMKPGETFERRLDPITISMGGAAFTRGATPFSLWMIQRLMDDYSAMPDADQQAVKKWAGGFSGGALFDVPIPRLERKGLLVTLT